ncbi:hypothetical protein KW803_02510 [Candidatus Saccharibacteria bacterium]|nr:hypothetical protein [Candidatus Saccharibacteria bacterium]
MDLIQSEQPNVPVEPEPRYVSQTASLPVEKTEHGHTWLRTIISILVGIVLIVLIVLFARWVYHKVHHKTASTSTTTSQTEGDTSSQTATSESQLQGSGSSSGSSSSSNSNSGSSNGSGSTNSSSSNSSSNSNNSTSTSSTNTDANPPIANTGPGNTVALFVGTSLIAGGLHYIISVRRFAKNQT